MKISKHFKREEFACNCGCGFDTVDVKLIEILEWLRSTLDDPINVNSGCRCKSHNKEIGGVEHSQHTLGRAADITTSLSPQIVADILNTGFGDKVSIGIYNDFVHVDSRSNGGARWDFSDVD